MAQRTEVQLLDDIDPSDTADETVRFGIDGTSYEIDLAAQRAEHLRLSLAPFVSAARRVANGNGNGKGRGPKQDASDRQRTMAIRQWARGQGMDVNERGRIPSRVIEAYDAAH
jgi:hypothetical protein